MAPNRFGASSLIVVCVLLIFSAISKASTGSLMGQSRPSKAEGHLSSSVPRDLQFDTVSRPTARPRCEASADPVALATPNPMLSESDAKARVIVSFIIGTDGRVHSPLVLESAGVSRDSTVLDAVRSWRFRPAMCNGTPTETEGEIEFSRR